MQKYCIVLLTKTGPRCISFRCKITVSLAQGAVHDAEADVADPVFVRSTIVMRLLLFQARPPPDRPQCERGPCRSRSRNSQTRRSRFHMRRRRPLHLHRPRHLCGGQLCRWWRLLGCEGHRRRDRYTGGGLSWYGCGRCVVAGVDGRLGVGCSCRRLAKKRPD